mmetsp:Transcript_81129/g.217993  ORF Transcript_81129/g.217993 Transcript_81129/m.217993 type:complete len:182 (+) Transcript_81129:519-1064(+)
MDPHLLPASDSHTYRVNARHGSYVPTTSAGGRNPRLPDISATASSAPEEGHPPVALEESLPGEGEPAPVPAPGAPTEAWNEGSSMASPGTGNWTSRGPPGAVAVVRSPNRCGAWHLQGACSGGVSQSNAHMDAKSSPHGTLEASVWNSIVFGVRGGGGAQPQQGGVVRSLNRACDRVGGDG